MKRRSFLARLRTQCTYKPQTNRTVRRLQNNFEPLESRQLLATMAGLEMAPGEVTDQQQIAVNTSSESLAASHVHQASDQQASAAIPDTLADSLAPAADINKTDVNTKHLDHLLTSPEIERSLDQLAQGLEMQPDFSSLYGLAEEVQADLEQFMDFVESQVLWQDITVRTWSDGSQSFWT
ncbi:MAG: hypothetical protein MK161_15245, partial [Pirellulales bacterium]|nr:hypothetical protein [Pirellulales bacterium]